MATKTKTFDCVEFKREAQRRLRAEYEARKGDFASYHDFVNAKAQESAWVRRMEKRFPSRG